MDLEKGRRCTIGTRNQRLATIHSLAHFIGDRSPEHVEWCGQIRSIPFKKADKNSITYLEKEEMDALLQVPDQSTRLGHRDYALLLFLYNSGARASEAISVTIEDLERNVDGTGIVKLHGKGRKVRFCPLWKKTMATLLPLSRGRPGDVRLFINRSGDPMTRFGVHAMVEPASPIRSQQGPILEAEARQPSHHSAQHGNSPASRGRRHQYDSRVVGPRVGGHNQFYAETDMAMKARALAACDPGVEPPNARLKWRGDPNLMQFLRSL